MAEKNKLAVLIAQYFFNITNKRATGATMKQSIGQAKSLLESGFTSEEIIQVLVYLVNHPPKDGLRSLGFLSYVMEDILIKLKAKQVKDSFNKVVANPTPETFLEESRKITHTIKPIQQRIGDEFNTNIFQ